MVKNMSLPTRKLTSRCRYRLCQANRRWITYLGISKCRSQIQMTDAEGVEAMQIPNVDKTRCRCKFRMPKLCRFRMYTNAEHANVDADVGVYEKKAYEVVNKKQQHQMRIVPQYNESKHIYKGEDLIDTKNFPLICYCTYTMN